jgi:hypothetical protein
MPKKAQKAKKKSGKSKKKRSPKTDSIEETIDCLTELHKLQGFLLSELKKKI